MVCPRMVEGVETETEAAMVEISAMIGAVRVLVCALVRAGRSIGRVVCVSVWSPWKTPADGV